MNLLKQLRGTEINPRTALFSVGLLLLLTVGVIAGVVKFMNRPAVSTLTTISRPAVITAQGVRSTGGAVKQHPARDYTVIVKRNIFRDKQAVAVATKRQPDTRPSKIPAPIFSMVPASVLPFQPFTDLNTSNVARPNLAYTGCVDIAGTAYALIENLDIGEAQYIQLDSMAFGCRLTYITAQTVTLDYQGLIFTLELGDNKTEVVTKPPTPPAGNAATTSPGNPSVRTPNGVNSQPGGVTPPSGRDGNFRDRGSSRRSNTGEG